MYLYKHNSRPAVYRETGVDVACILRCFASRQKLEGAVDHTRRRGQEVFHVRRRTTVPSQHVRLGSRKTHPHPQFRHGLRVLELRAEASANPLRKRRHLPVELLAFFREQRLVLVRRPCDERDRLFEVVLPAQEVEAVADVAHEHANILDRHSGLRALQTQEACPLHRNIAILRSPVARAGCWPDDAHLGKRTIHFMKHGFRLLAHEVVRALAHDVVDPLPLRRKHILHRAEVLREQHTDRQRRVLEALHLLQALRDLAVAVAEAKQLAAAPSLRRRTHEHLDGVPRAFVGGERLTTSRKRGLQLRVEAHHPAGRECREAKEVREVGFGKPRQRSEVAEVERRPGRHVQHVRTDGLVDRAVALVPAVVAVDETRAPPERVVAHANGLEGDVARAGDDDGHRARDHTVVRRKGDLRALKRKRVNGFVQ